MPPNLDPRQGDELGRLIARVEKLERAMREPGDDTEFVIVTSTITVSAASGSLFTFSFSPVAFIERPIPSFGAEQESAGSWSIAVSAWATSGALYTGATFRASADVPTVFYWSMGGPCVDV